MKKLLTLLLLICLIPHLAIAEDILFSFVGDLSIGDSQQYKNASSSFHTMVDEKGYDFPFAQVASYLQSDDLTLGNLEVVFTTRTAHQDKKHYLSADPDHVQILHSGGIDVVNTVNNHTMDFHMEGYLDSMQCLDENGIGRFGYSYAARDVNAFDTLVQEVKGVRFGFVGFSYPSDKDLKRIENRIRALKEEEGCQVVIVSLHWGKEEQMTPSAWQLPYAKQVLDAGADMIWGHHPHVIQPIQFYKGKPILYSTGNFIFGTMSSVDPSTGIFQVTWEKTEEGVSMKKLQVIPCETQLNPVFQPFELTDEQARRDVWDELTFNREHKGFQNPPDSFLETGIVLMEDLSE